jgi:hypothetical protein
MQLFLQNILLMLLYNSILFIVISTAILEIKYETTINIEGQKNIDSTQILIVGDSRADQQLNPQIIHTNLGLNVLNIAEAAMDLFSLTLRLKKLSIKDKFIIISASSWQINDGAIDPGYFRIEAYNHLNASQRLRLYTFNIKELLKISINNLFIKHSLYIGNESRFLNKGFNNKVECTDFDTVNMFNKHPWYQNIKLNGIKIKLLKEALLELNKLDCKGIIIYNAPVYSLFAEKAKSNGIWNMENEYSYIIANFIKTKG